MGYSAVRWLAAAVTVTVALAGWGLVPAGAGAAATLHSASAAARARPAAGARPAAADATACPYASDNSPSGYIPSQLQDAYQLPSATSGSRMVVAVVTPFDYPNAETDLCVYRSQFGLAACNSTDGCFTEVNQAGQASPLPGENASWGLNTAEQLDMISATCPNCRIILVETNNAAIANVGAGIDTAISMGADIVTTSVIQPEIAADTTSDTTYFDHPGVVITAPAGGSGYQVGYPATSPDVVAVGGTTLTQAGVGGCATSARGWCETTWNDSAESSLSGATGSGCSAYEPKPSWQTDTGCAFRTDNDLSADADPNTGVAVYDSGEDDWQGGTGAGGTAVAAAIVAGAYALDGQSSGSPASYPYLHGTADSVNDITTGNDLPPGGTCSPAYLCTAGPGYDGPTGLGSPAGTTALSASGLGGTVHSAKFGMCLDNASGTLKDANLVDIDLCNEEYNAQQWIVEADGTIHLRSTSGAALSWCLDVYHSGTADFTPVDLYNCNGGGAQQWRPQSDGEIINPESGLCLTDPNGSTTSGTQIQIRTCGDYLSQQWALPYATPVAKGEITAQDTGRCLDNLSSDLRNANVIDAHACNGGADSQEWTVENDGTIRLPSNFCLDVYHSGDTSGSIVDLFGCLGSGSQQWLELSDGALVNPESGLCLTDSATAGTQLKVQTCTGAANQSWTLPKPALPS